MKTISTFVLLTCSLLWLLPQLCIADSINKCTKFIPSSNIADQLNEPVSIGLLTRQVSSVIHCPAGKPDKYYDCFGPSQRGCQALDQIQGGIGTIGNTNFTADVSEIRHLAELVTASLPKDAQPFAGIYGTTTGCFEPKRESADFLFETNGGVCIPEGTTGYIEFTPDLYCAAGKLSGCSGSDNFYDNFYVKVCGVRIYEVWFLHLSRCQAHDFPITNNMLTDLVLGTKAANQLPRGTFNAVRVNASEADRYENNPSLDKARQALCDSVKSKRNVAAPGVATTGASALAAFLASVALALF